MTDRIEYEIVSADRGFLEGRFHVDGKTIVCAIHWNGQNMDEALTQAAIMARYVARMPPRPTQEMLQDQVGRNGVLDVEV